VKGHPRRMQKNTLDFKGILGRLRTEQDHGGKEGETWQRREGRVRASKREGKPNTSELRQRKDTRWSLWILWNKELTSALKGLQRDVGPRRDLYGKKYRGCTTERCPRGLGIALIESCRGWALGRRRSIRRELAGKRRREDGGGVTPALSWGQKLSNLGIILLRGGGGCYNGEDEQAAV